MHNYMHKTLQVKWWVRLKYDEIDDGMVLELGLPWDN